MNKARSLFLVVCAALPAFLLLLSCPNPIDASLARKVEDQTAPLITILVPDPLVKTYFSSVITISGTAEDFADAAGRRSGSVQSLSYEEQYNKRIHGSTADGGVTLAADGSFSLTIDAINPEMLSGTQVIILTAVDWNGNSSTDFVTLYDKTTGPLIAIYDHEPTDYNWYSSALNAALTIRGKVELPTFILTYDVEADGLPVISNVGIPWGSSGEFEFDFNPFAAGASGQLKFILKANDGANQSSTIFYLTDDPVAPRLTSGAVAADNASVNLVFSEGIYHTGAADPLLTDFALVFAKGSGTATNTALTGLSGAPMGGVTSIDLGIAVTGQPSGAETITLSGPSLTDRVGNPLSPAYGSVTLSLRDKTAPVVTQVSSTLPLGSARNAGKAVPITITFSEPVTVTPPLTLALNVGAPAAYASGSGTSTITLNYTIQAGHNVDPLNYTAVADLEGTVADAEGNPASLTLPAPALPAALAARDLRIDTLVPADPAVLIQDGDGFISKAENLAGVSFTVEGEPGAAYDLSGSNYALIVAGSDPEYLPATGFVLRASATGTFTVSVSVTLTDSAGNSSSGSTTSQANLTAPNPPVVTTAVNPTNNTTPTWSWSSGGNGNGTFRYRLDNSDLSAETPTTATFFFPTVGLTETEHTLYVQERNSFGNWSDSGSLAILIDLTPPGQPSFQAATSPTNDPRPTWSWNSGSGGAGWFRYRLDNSTLDGQPETQDLSYTPVTSLADGDRILYLQERDAAGNWSGSASQTITIDTTPPDPPTVWTDGNNPTTDVTPTWRWSSAPVNGGNGTFRRRLDGGTLSGPITSTSYTAPTQPVGEHTLEVQERDELGNWSSFTSFMIEVSE